MKLSEDDWIDRSVLYSKEIKEYKNRKVGSSLPSKDTHSQAYNAGVTTGGG